MKKRKKSFKLIKMIMCLIILFFICEQSKEHLIIYKKSENKNKNYSGEGQVYIENKDGYNTIFKTKDDNEYKEYKQGGTLSSWASNDYWGGTMEENGCGITSIAIILSRYGFDYTPEDLREKYSPHLAGENISKELNDTYGIECTDFYFSNVYFSKKYVFEHLEKEKPILVCVWDKPNEKWTEKSHYMVLLATDGIDKIYVSNPNGSEEENPSGWYNEKAILPYIAKALFIEE